MLFPEEDAAAVKQWLIRELEPLCDADPDVLADYVLALFKNDTGEDELVAMLNEQLVDFLEGNTESFVRKAVDTLKNRSYTAGAGQTRKREDVEDIEVEEEHDDQPSKRQAYDAHDAQEPHDVQNSNNANDEQQTATSQGEGGESHAHVQSRPRRSPRVPKGWCRDYHTLGFCSRGANCKFLHSDDSIMGTMPQVPAPPPPFSMPAALPFMPPFPMGPDGSMPPDMMGMMPMPEHFAQMMQQMQQMAGTNGMMMGGRGGGMSRGSARRGSRGRGGSTRGGLPSSAPHAPVARSQDTIVIENIPSENLELVHVNDYFKRFGTITNIEVDKPNKKALVTYATPAEADQAHKSPDVIFGNRFVKVYFQRLERPPPSKPNYMNDKGSNVYLAPELRSATSATMTPADEEKHRLLELRKKRQTLVHMQLAEQKALLQKLENKDLTPQGRKSIMTMLEKLSAEIKGATEMLKKDIQSSNDMGSASTTEELQAKLAQLKAEAASLGLDTKGHPTSMAYRGAYRGRGSSSMPSFRGRGRGSTMMMNRSMTLDNRTTKVGISGLPAGYDASKLQEHVQQFGDINSMEYNDDQVIVTYKNRASSERAMRAGGSIPDVGNASLAWVEAPVAPMPPSLDNNASGTPTDTAPVSGVELDEGSERENWKR